MGWPKGKSYSSASRGDSFTYPKKPNPCLGGKGTFLKKLKENQQITLGEIPAHMANVEVNLRTDKDVDTELWAPGGNHTKGKKKKEGAKEIAIIAWRVGKINSPNARSIKYKGATIYYSGYNGIPSKDGTLNFGHEDIKIKGSSTSPFVVKAYAFEAGMARVTYRWTANKAACKKQQAEQKVKATTKETQHKHVKELQAKKAAEQSRKAKA